LADSVWLATTPFGILACCGISFDWLKFNDTFRSVLLLTIFMMQVIKKLSGDNIQCDAVCRMPLQNTSINKPIQMDQKGPT
jgi:hypothetical protein